jgi:hypothetical protein
MLRPEQCDAELFDRCLDLLGGTFITGQIEDQLPDPVKIRFPGLTYAWMHRPIFTGSGPLGQPRRFGWHVARR